MVEFSLFRSSNEKFDEEWQCKLQSATGKKLVGIRESAKAIRQKLAECVYIAEDADSTVVAPIADECRIRGIGIVFVPSKEELGEAVGIDVSASIVTILKSHRKEEKDANL